MEIEERNEEEVFIEQAMKKILKISEEVKEEVKRCLNNFRNNNKEIDELLGRNKDDK
jgi:hypothetical protein